MPRHRNRAQAWALVTKRGHVYVETVRWTRRQTANMQSDHDRMVGTVPRRVEVKVEIEERFHGGLDR